MVSKKKFTALILILFLFVGFVRAGRRFIVTRVLVVLCIPGYATVGIGVAHITGKSIVAPTTNLYHEGIYE